MIQHSATKTRGNVLSFVTLSFRDREYEGETREKANEKSFLYRYTATLISLVSLSLDPLMLYPVLVCSYSSAGRRPLVVG